VAFTSSIAEQNQLAGGNIDLGAVDPSVLTQPAPAPGKAGANWSGLNGKYNLVVVPTFSNNYMNLNFGKNPGAKFLQQLYIRQALQLAINQPSIIKNALKNYAVPTWSELPPSTPASESGAITQPYPFSLTKAAALLKDHGWTKSGVSLVCSKPGAGATDCGAGIAAGDVLKLNIEWYSGIPSLDSEMNAIIDDWTTLGITTTHSTGPLMRRPVRARRPTPRRRRSTSVTGAADGFTPRTTSRPASRCCSRVRGPTVVSTPTR